MLRAVFVRTLRPGVTYEQFKAAWVPEPGDGDYPAVASVSRNPECLQQVMTIIEVDASLEEFATIRASLARPDAAMQLDQIVQSTQLEGVFEEVFNAESF